MVRAEKKTTHLRSLLSTLSASVSKCHAFFFSPLGEYLDILAISCDSFDEATNQLIGRTQGRKSHLDSLYKIRQWCQQYKVAFKINSVINTFNVDEDMSENITQLGPVRWKVRDEDEKVFVWECARIPMLTFCPPCSGVPVSADRRGERGRGSPEGGGEVRHQ